jgi:predicted phage terminase large subunit-like protein
MDYAAVRARDDFWIYRQVMNPGMKIDWFPRHVAGQLIQFYQDYKAGLRPVRLIQTPPQVGKSLTTIDFAAWVAGQDPNTRIIFASFSERLAMRANLRVQRALGNEVYQRAFPDTTLGMIGVHDATQTYLRNTNIIEFRDHDGYFRSTTVLGSVTGESLDIGILDDVIKGREAANSATVRDKVWSWLSDDFLTRFSEHAALVFIGTRWHLDDPAGRLIERYRGGRLRVLRYQAIAEPDDWTVSLGLRRTGEALFPGLKSLSSWKQRKHILTSASWEALYQQAPVVRGGGLFPLDKFRLMQLTPDRHDIKRSVRYIDKAGTRDGGAYTALVLIHRMNDDRYVVGDVRRGQWSALEREKIIAQTAELDMALNLPVLNYWVEQEPGSGGKESAESTVRMLGGLGVAARADKVTGAKELRADPYAAQVQAGNVALIMGNWNRDFLDEHELFPAGKFKDQVDAAAGAFNKLVGSSYDASLAWVG